MNRFKTGLLIAVMAGGFTLPVLAQTPAPSAEERKENREIRRDEKDVRKDDREINKDRRERDAAEHREQADIKKGDTKDARREAAHARREQREINKEKRERKDDRAGTRRDGQEREREREAGHRK